MRGHFSLRANPKNWELGFFPKARTFQIRQVNQTSGLFVLLHNMCNRIREVRTATAPCDKLYRSVILRELFEVSDARVGIVHAAGRAVLSQNIVYLGSELLQVLLLQAPARVDQYVYRRECFVVQRG